MTTRRLAAIFAADVAGFSAMMERDEEGTAARIRALRQDVIEPALNKHQGRLVKTTGDGFLAEFASPVEAVRAAISVQDQLAFDESPKERLQLRIGINVGDIIIEADGDVLGEGVNVAARLEQIAAPGGITISGWVHDQVAGKIDRAFEEHGEQQLKNIARPVRVYGLNPEEQARRLEPVPLALPDMPSIAVLPFINMSGPEEDYFCDGLVDDITTALSRLRWFFVIARSSSFSYKGQTVDVKKVSRELGVRYVLEGSVRKSGDRIRVTGQLVEAATGFHIWADRFDGSSASVFDLQDRMTESVVSALEPSIRRAEIDRVIAKPTKNLSAYDCYLRSLPNYYERTESGVRRALNFLHRAIELDPTYALAQASAALCYATLVDSGWYRDSEPDAREKAVALARAAIMGSRDDPTTLFIAGHMLGYLERDYDAALAALDSAIALNPNSAAALARSGWVRLYVGDASTAFDHFHRAMRLSPIDPDRHFTSSGIAMAHAFVGDFEKALEWGHQSIRHNVLWASGHRVVIFALVSLDRLGEAHEATQRLLLHFPKYTVANLVERAPFKDRDFVARYVNALRTAGLPE